MLNRVTNPVVTLSKIRIQVDIGTADQMAGGTGCGSAPGRKTGENLATALGLQTGLCLVEATRGRSAGTGRPLRNGAPRGVAGCVRGSERSGLIVCVGREQRTLAGVVSLQGA